jgi:hypothetical protein
MTKEEFKKKWESDDDGGGITNEDIASCYIEWGLGRAPYSQTIDYVIWRVCESANTNDKKYWEKRALRSDE